MQRSTLLHVRVVTSQALGKDDRKVELVGSPVYERLFISKLFGCCVSRSTRSHGKKGVCQCGLIEHADYPKVCEDRDTIGSKKHIRWLDVAMNKTSLMQMFKHFRQRQADVTDLVRRQDAGP